MDLKQRPPVKELDFEEAFQELEEIVEVMESGELSLEQALQAFERGQALAARCTQLLEEAELKLTQLVPGEAGSYEQADFEPE